MKTKEWLIDKRVKNGYTQAQLAKLCNISVFTIENIEQGKRLGSVETWNKIESFFNDENDINVSFESSNIIEEIKEDINLYTESCECILIYKVKYNNIIFVDYYLKEIDKKFELNTDEYIIETTLKYALEVFENQNKIM